MSKGPESELPVRRPAIFTQTEAVKKDCDNFDGVSIATDRDFGC